jgi:hypothetical protein
MHNIYMTVIVYGTTIDSPDFLSSKEIPSDTKC